MKVSKQTVREKKAYARGMILKHPSYHIFMINDMVEEKFGHKLRHTTLSKMHKKLVRDGQLVFKFAEEKPAEPKPDPVAERHAKRMVYVKPAPKTETIPGPINLPAPVVAAVQLALEAQRENRVEQVTIHANGTVSARVLAGIEGQVYLGGRRASDPKSEV